MVIKDAKRRKKSSEDGPITGIDLLTLTTFCRYILQPHSLVKLEHLVNLRRLMSAFKPSSYENDVEKTKRVNFIIRGLEARLDNNINDTDLVLNYINGGINYKVDFIDYDNLYFTKYEVQLIHKMVSENLQYAFLYERTDELLELCTRFKTTSFAKKGTVVEDFKRIIDESKNAFRMAETENTITDMTFSLREDKFDNVIKNTYNIITNPSRRLLCGMQGLNEMTGGGFESGRVYMFLGTSGVGKSVTLLNIARQIKMYNRDYQTKDPTKIPCVVILTMENTVIETITRLFDLVIEGSKGMANYDIDEVISMLRTNGELYLNDSSPIDIIIKYKANNSVNTSYLYTLYDDLDDEGYEMICLIQDHIKRIRSIYPNNDLRLELGDRVNEFKVFAAEKDIPVITNSHLNRDAAKIIEDASRKQNQDVGKLLGKSNVGESMLMIDNLDSAIIIAIDYDEEGNRYLVLNNVKHRDRVSRTYMAQPFAVGSTIRLVEDVGMVPQFKESLHSRVEARRNNIVKISSSSVMTSTIDDITDSEVKDKNINTFNSNKVIYNLLDEDDSTYEVPISFSNEYEVPITFVNESMESFESDLEDLEEMLNNK